LAVTTRQLREVDVRARDEWPMMASESRRPPGATGGRKPPEVSHVSWYGSADPERGRQEHSAPDPTMVGGYRGGGPPPTRQLEFSAVRLWTGGAVTAIIAAGVSVVGFLVVRNLLRMPILGVHPSGSVFQPTMAGYSLSAALAAVLATAVMHLLLVGTPRPLFYFSWIGALCTAILVLIPLGVRQVWSQVIPVAAINLVVGIAITLIVRGTAAASLPPAPQGVTRRL
jgi:hypothetical protein